MLPDESVLLSMFVGSRSSGMFLRGPRNADREPLHAFMTKHVEALERAFGPSGSTQYYYQTTTGIAIQEEARWDELIDWMDEQRRRYVEVFRGIGTRECVRTD